MSAQLERLAAWARVAVLTVGDVSVLCTVRPHPHELARIATHPAVSLDRLGADATIAGFALAALWLAAAWVAVGLLAALGARLPGLTGHACAAVAAVTVPAAARRVLIGAIGIGLVAGPATSALAAPAHDLVGGPGVAASSLARNPRPGPSWPTSNPSHPTRHAPDRAHPPNDTVHVRDGDSLWLIAARRLGDGESAGRIAAYWPRVYAANRSVIGPDPGLVVPGQVLHLPDPRLP